MSATQGLRVSVVAMAVLFGLAGVASPAFAAPKGKKAASSESKSVDDMMGESAKPKKKADDADTAEEPKKQEEEVAEPDEWEKPVQEEKAPAKKDEAPVAEEKVGDDRQFEAGLLLGWAFVTDKGFASLDPFGLGFGLRLGYEFDFKLFVGAGFEYFLGSSDTLNKAAGAGAITKSESSANYMHTQVEVGYDIWVSDLILRPSLWLGAAIGTQDPHPLTNNKRTVTDLFFGPGASLLYILDGYFIGGDLRLLKATGDGASSVSLFLTGGLRF